MRIIIDNNKKIKDFFCFKSLIFIIKKIYIKKNAKKMLKRCCKICQSWYSSTQGMSLVTCFAIL